MTTTSVLMCILLFKAELNLLQSLREDTSFYFSLAFDTEIWIESNKTFHGQ